MMHGARQEFELEGQSTHERAGAGRLLLRLMLTDDDDRGLESDPDGARVGGATLPPGVLTGGLEAVSVAARGLVS